MHNLQVLPRDCNYPKGIVVLLTINALLFIYLFGSFYVKTYNKSKMAPKVKDEMVKEGNNSPNGKFADEVSLSNGKLLNGNLRKLRN